MMRYKIIFRRALLVIISCIAIAGLISYEIHSINQKEYARQVDIANNARGQIKLNLNLIKIAIQTNDYEKYNDSFLKLRENSSKIEPLALIANEQKPYLELLHVYMVLLESNKNLLAELCNINKSILAIEKTFKNDYGDKDAISSEKLVDLSEKIEQLKISDTGYIEDAVLTVLNTVNELLTDIASKSNNLAKCIDSCYKDHIARINDELAEKLKNFANQTEILNQAIEDRFDFDTLNKLINS